MNDINNISPITLWEAYKASIRGKLTQMASRLPKACKVDIEWLEKEFLLLSKQHKRNSSSGSVEKLEAACTASNLALTAIAEKSLHWEGGWFYYQKDKTGSLLATRLTPKIRTQTLPKNKSTQWFPKPSENHGSFS